MKQTTIKYASVFTLGMLAAVALQQLATIVAVVFATILVIVVAQEFESKKEKEAK